MFSAPNSNSSESLKPKLVKKYYSSSNSKSDDFSTKKKHSKSLYSESSTSAELKKKDNLFLEVIPEGSELSSKTPQKPLNLTKEDTKKANANIIEQEEEGEVISQNDIVLLEDTEPILFESENPPSNQFSQNPQPNPQPNLNQPSQNQNPPLQSNPPANQFPPSNQFSPNPPQYQPQFQLRTQKSPVIDSHLIQTKTKTVYVQQDNATRVNTKYTEPITISNFKALSKEEQKEIIRSTGYMSKTTTTDDNHNQNKVLKRVMVDDTKLQLTLRDEPINVNIIFKLKGEVKTLKETFLTLLEQKGDLDKVKERMEQILSTTISKMDDNKRTQLAKGFALGNDFKTKEIAKKITKQILKELNIKDDGKSI